MKYSAHEVALAFNTANDKKSWTARATTRPEQGMNLVHFTSNTGLVILTYDADTERFSVKFNKYNAAWGDYIGSTARSLMAVLTTLKAGGLAFDAPTSAEGMEMTVTNAIGSMVYVRYVHETPPPPKKAKVADAIMPELLGSTLADSLGVDPIDLMHRSILVQPNETVAAMNVRESEAVPPGVVEFRDPATEKLLGAVVNADFEKAELSVLAGCTCGVEKGACPVHENNFQKYLTP